MSENTELRGKESPLKEEYDLFDIEHADWTELDYIKYALTVPPELTTNLVVDDWRWRAQNFRNIVASIEGEQGSGKSLFFKYAGLLLGKIYGVPFTTNHIYYAPEELEQAISNAKKRETFLRDEHKRTSVGLMANMVADNLADYEDQLRKHQNNLLYASVDLQRHSHFFIFEAKHTISNVELKGYEDGYPVQVLAMLKTPRYTDRKSFVWRGMVAFPTPNRQFWNESEKKKDEHLQKLKSKYGNTLDIVGYHAQQIVEKREKDLVRKTNDGFIIPIKEQLMYFIVSEELGTGRFTTTGYNMLLARIRDTLMKKYEEENQKVSRAIQEDRAAAQELREKRFEEQQKSREEKTALREKLLAQKMAAEKERLEKKLALKQKALELKEKELVMRANKKTEDKEGK